MVEPTRIQVLRDLPPKPDARYVLYWMQSSQRTTHNPALEYAAATANDLRLPLVVCFGLMDNYPEANARHYAFMLDGLADVARRLDRRGIRFVVKHGNPPEVALHYARDAAVVVCDRNYLRHHKAWRLQVAREADRRVVQVEGDVVVPVETASDKAEFAARTLRPKIHKLYASYLTPLPETPINVPAARLKVSGDIDPVDPAAALAKLRLDRSVQPVSHFKGGETEAQRRLGHFIEHLLRDYAEGRNEPAAGATSHLSPYLHFGQISPVHIALAVRDARGPKADTDAFLEELIVRRELAINHAFYNEKYDQYAGLPEWARKTLAAHARDRREHLYSLEQLETAQTHDPYWNAAQLEMTRTGFMHNYMRMYWGKKILEWTRTPEEGFAWNLYLNNKYFLDGRDANSYTGVAWCYGLHDRPWGPERPVYGMVRYMNAAGLERKFDIKAYVKKVALLG
ncbi:MAG: deoxyribodipyrimidine photo-lyase [Tepidisphaerales bacterium]